MNNKTQGLKTQGLGSREKILAYVFASVVLGGVLASIGYAIFGTWGLVLGVLPLVACFAKVVNVESQLPQSKEGYDKKLLYLLGATGAKKYKNRCLSCGASGSFVERRSGSRGRLAMSCSRCKNIAYFIEKN